jgi:hypothetical protein
MIRRYIYPVDAGPGGATLLVLSPGLFATIADVADRASFAGELFRNLRDKLLVNVWNFYGERIEDEKDKNDQKRNPWQLIKSEYIKDGVSRDGWNSAKLQRLAKGIMSLASLEAYDAERPTDGNTIFCGPNELHLHTGETVEFIKSGLGLFDRLGLVRWYGSPLYKLRGLEQIGVFRDAFEREKEESGKQISVLIEEIWLRWKKLAYRHLVARPLAASNGKDIGFYDNYHEAKLGLLSTKEGFGAFRPRFLFGMSNEAEAELKHVFTLLKSKGVSRSDANDLVCRWLANVAYLNIRLVRAIGTDKAQSGRVIRILAPHELRQLAFNESEFLRVFADRLAAFPKPTASLLKQMRAERYVELIESFLSGVWASNGDCYMSGMNLERKEALADFQRVIRAAAAEEK